MLKTRRREYYQRQEFYHFKYHKGVAERVYCLADVNIVPLGSGMMRACVKISSIRRGRENHLNV